MGSASEGKRQMYRTRAPVKDVLSRLLRIMLPAGTLPALTYFVPPLNPFKLPHIDLTGSLAVAAYWIAESGGTIGIPLIGITLTALLVSRAGVPWKHRAAEALAVVLVLAALLGGGAALNEHMVKPFFAVPRPNIIELAELPPNAPALKMSVEEFYALPDTASRSEHLKKVLEPEIRLHECVRAHWISETGYSFPSGHSFSSMLFATFFLAMGLTYFSGHRLWVFYLVAPWAVAVCCSRPILRVHSLTDVGVGALEGITAGVLAFLLVRQILATLTPGPAVALARVGQQVEGGSAAEA
jgi:phosphatidylglycerophosphatase B